MPFFSFFFLSVQKCLPPFAPNFEPEFPPIAITPARNGDATLVPQTPVQPP
jgi:hypothetical protein